LSDQDNYMEGIVALIKCYILHQKLSKSVKNSWRYWGFAFPFGRFWWFWGFQQASPSRRSGLFM